MIIAKVGRGFAVAGAALSVLAFAVAANAQTFTNGPLTITPIPSTSTDFTQTFSVPQFDPSLGFLQSAVISFTSGISSNITVTNNAASASNGHVSTHVTVGLTDPGGVLPDPAFNGSGNVNAGGFAVVVASANFNYALAAGGTAGPATRTGTNTTQMTFSSSSNPGVLAELTGTGNTDFTAKTYSQTIVTNTGGNTTAAQSTTANVSGTVTYTYTSAPEPGSLALAGIGLLGGIAGIRRRKAA
jgi:hypothetical protein